MKERNPFEYSYEDMRNLSLTPLERADMRANLREFMAEHPVRPTFFERISAPQGNRRMYLRPVLAGALIVVLVTSGTSYAAADALPGDFLYAVKVNVSEPVANALALTAEAKASHSASLAVKRLEEAEILASEGRLTSETRAELENKFEAHVASFEDKTLVLADDESNVDIIADVQSDLEASLKVHAAVLAELSASMPEAEAELAPIQVKVAARAEAVELARTVVESVIATKVDDKIRKAASEKKRIAEREVSERRSSRVAAKAPEPQPEAATMMMAAFVAEDAVMMQATSGDPALDQYDQGEAALEIGQYGEAFTKFQGALRAIKQEKLKADVKERLNYGSKGKKGDEGAWSNDAASSNASEDNEDNSERGVEEKREEEHEDEDEKDDGKDEREATSTIRSIVPEQFRGIVPNLSI